MRAPHLRRCLKVTICHVALSERRFACVVLSHVVLGSLLQVLPLLLGEWLQNFRLVLTKRIFDVRTMSSAQLCHALEFGEDL